MFRRRWEPAQNPPSALHGINSLLAAVLNEGYLSNVTHTGLMQCRQADGSTLDWTMGNLKPSGILHVNHRPSPLLGLYRPHTSVILFFPLYVFTSNRAYSR